MSNIQDQRHTESFRQKRHIVLHDISGFSFMKRYKTAAYKRHVGSKDKYGPGVLTLHLKGNHEKAFYLHPSQHPGRIVRYLLSREIPFDNYKPGERTSLEMPGETYKRPSLYMFYFFVLFITFILLGFWAVSLSQTWSFCLAGVSFLISLYLINMLMTRFCYLELNNEGMHIYTAGREIGYSYDNILKVNFDFAREQNFTHIMELLDKDYNYHLFYIGRVSRKDLDEIAGKLQKAGIDATCSLNKDKRYYRDTILTGN
mgnify:CR=1 FL=1